MRASARKSRKRALEPLELELTGGYEPLVSGILGSVEEQQVLLLLEHLFISILFLLLIQFSLKSSVLGSYQTF